MHEKLIHRGGDASGIYLTPHAGLSHQRLSIRDITHGAQPMIRHRDGADYAIVYNGEIYNTDELIPELTAAGYNFLTTSDTEVILYAYMHFGASFVSRLNGIFSFAIWDGAAKQLFLYRDRVGTKPLSGSFTRYYRKQPERTACSRAGAHPRMWGFSGYL